MQTWRSGTRVIARRPWPGPWSSTIVPVSAMPSTGAGDDRVDARRGRPRTRRPVAVDDGAGDVEVEAGGYDDPRALGQGSADPGRQLGGGAALDDGPVVGDPLGEQLDQVGPGSGVRRGTSATGGSRRRGRRPPGRAPGSRRGRSSTWCPLPGSASTRRGTTPRRGREVAGAGPARRPARGADRARGGRRGASYARRGPTRDRPGRTALGAAEPPGVAKVQAAPFIASASAFGRPPRWASTTWARRSTSIDGMSILTGQTS